MSAPSPPLPRRRWRLACLRAADRCAACIDVAVRGTGPVLSVAVVLLTALCTRVYFTHVLPAARPGLGEGRAAAWTALGLWLVACMGVHYWRVSLCGPGRAPRGELSPALRAALRADPQLDPAALEEDPGARRWCKHCRAAKPMRTHHCSVCGVCVLKMDHHCPWMNNCVGHRNLRHFYLFLAHTAAACALFLRVGWTPLVGPALRTRTEVGAEFLVALVTVLAVLMAAALFVAWNTYLVLTNQTTIEFYGNTCGGDRRPRNTCHTRPYDLGWRENWRQVFGTGLWFLLPWTVTEGAGLVFPVRPDKEGEGQAGGARYKAHETTLDEIVVTVDDEEEEEEEGKNGAAAEECCNQRGGGRNEFM